MSDESIIIPIVVEPGKGLQGLSSFVNDANKRLSLIKGFKDGKLDIKVTVSTGNAPQQFTLLGKKAQEATDKIKKMGDQGSNTLMNIGRIAQDAPFGFMGIANNINPLLESFQRLQVTTGSTKGALGALASQLTGPAGLGLAVSVVSSLLVVFGDKLLGSSKKRMKRKSE